MNRRSFVASVVGWLAVLFTGRPLHARPVTTSDGYRLLYEPYFIESGVPIGMIAQVADPQ